jgi:hypothetical protein
LVFPLFLPEGLFFLKDPENGLFTNACGLLWDIFLHWGLVDEASEDEDEGDRDQENLAIREDPCAVGLVVHWNIPYLVSCCFYQKN